MIFKFQAHQKKFRPIKTSSWKTTNQFNKMKLHQAIWLCSIVIFLYKIENNKTIFIIFHDRIKSVHIILISIQGQSACSCRRNASKEFMKNEKFSSFSSRNYKIDDWRKLMLFMFFRNFWWWIFREYFLIRLPCEFIVCFFDDSEIMCTSLDQIFVWLSRFFQKNPK